MFLKGACCVYSSVSDKQKTPNTGRFSETIDLPDEVLQYLLEDGLVLPEGCEDRLVRSGLNSDSDDDETDWDAGDTATAAEPPKFPEFNSTLQAAISRLGGGVFPKLNWSSPKDAGWITLGGTLKCTCPKDIFLLMKSSSFLAHDLVEPLMDCADYDAVKKIPIQYYMVLRRWHNMYPAYEFRCFARDSKLIAISQRHHSSHFDFLQAEKADIVQDIKDFYKQHICGQFPDKSVTFDVYREAQGKVWLVDFNPFGELTDALLFTWDELRDIDPAQTGPDMLPVQRLFNVQDIHVIPDTLSHYGVPLPVVRLVDVQGIQPHPLRQYGMPVDIVHLTTGADANKLVDLMNLQVQGKHDSTDEEEPQRSDKNS